MGDDLSAPSRLRADHTSALLDPESGHQATGGYRPGSMHRAGSLPPAGRRPLSAAPAMPAELLSTTTARLSRRTLAWQRRLVRTVLGVDVVAAILAAVLAALLRFGDPSLRYLLVTVAFPVVWVVTCASTRCYEPRFLGTGSDEFRRVADAGFRLLALVALISFTFELDLARLYVLIALPSTVLLTLLGRSAARQLLYRRRADGRCLHKVVVVGRERSCAELIQQFRRESHAGFCVVGACVSRPSGPQVEGVDVVGTADSIIQALLATEADTVAVGAWSDLTQADLRRLSWQLEGTGIDLVLAPSLTDVAGPRIHIRPVAGLPLLHVEEPEFTGGRRQLKAAMDRIVAAVTLVLLSPLLLALLIAVRLSSPGPSFFRQTRVGAGGRTFSMIKFRSMYVDAERQRAHLDHRNEAADGLLFKIRADPRVTRVGRTLRRFSLDELPQLVNVARGDMSLVGPRPPLPGEEAAYADDVHRRLLVKPGLTGLWQISGRSDLPWEESVRLDLHYVENWSLALDFVILCKTARAVLCQRGAY